VRRSHVPALFAPQMTVTVPFRTRVPRYRAGRQATVGVVGAGETARWSLPAPPGRRARLVAVAGQSARRLRVVTLRVTTPPVDNLPVPLDRAAAAARSSAPDPDRLTWLDDQYRR
jgi:hypothetical protein